MSSLYTDTNYDLTFDDLNITPEFITTCIQDPFYSSITNGATDYNSAQSLSNDSFPGASYQSSEVTLDRYNQSSKISSKFLDQISQDNDADQTSLNHATNNNVLSNGSSGNVTSNSLELADRSSMTNQAVPKLKIKFIAKPNQNGHDVNDVIKVCKYSVVKDDTDIQCAEERGESGDLAIDESMSEENLLGSISDIGERMSSLVQSSPPRPPISGLTKKRWYSEIGGIRGDDCSTK